jgi:hypothetical protein
MGENLMQNSLNKVLAISIILLTAIGILLSLFLVIQTWRLRMPVTERLQTIASQTNAILGTTEQGLEIIGEIVTNVYTSTTSLESSTTSLAQTSRDSSQFIGSIGSFLGEGLVNTITNTQIAINSAQSSAVVIDNILTAMSNIPFIGIDYNPTRPLNVALGEVSTSLDPLQGNLLGFETNLKTTQTSLKEFRICTRLDQNNYLRNNNLHFLVNLGSGCYIAASNRYAEKQESIYRPG